MGLPMSSPEIVAIGVLSNGVRRAWWQLYQDLLIETTMEGADRVMSEFGERVKAAQTDARTTLEYMQQHAPVERQEHPPVETEVEQFVRAHKHPHSA